MVLHDIFIVNECLQKRDSCNSRQQQKQFRGVLRIKSLVDVYWFEWPVHKSATKKLQYGQVVKVHKKTSQLLLINFFRFHGYLQKILFYFHFNILINPVLVGHTTHWNGQKSQAQFKNFQCNGNSTIYFVDDEINWLKESTWRKEKDEKK